MKYLRISLWTQFVLAIYFQIINWFSLGSWNNQSGFVPLIRSLISGKAEWTDIALISAFLIPFLLCLLAYYKQLIWLLWVGVCGYSFWFFLQIKTWWIPYLLGASARWEEIYHRVFAHTTKVIPSFGRHLAPDAMHLAIQLLLLILIMNLIIGLIQIQRKKQPFK
jgi:hypothetical protein